jgi:hypothetical protein
MTFMQLQRYYLSPTATLVRGAGQGQQGRMKQPLTEHERDQILSQTGHGGQLIGTLAGPFALVAIIAVVVVTGHIDWWLLGGIAMVMLGGAAVIWAIITGTDRGLKREVEAGEKMIVDGHVAALSVQETNGVYFHCLRFQPGDSAGAPLSVTVPERVYRQLQEREPVQLAHLPISKLALGVTTTTVRWRIGDA